MEYSNLFVCLMGICTVFIGLICIIILVSVMSGIVRKTEKNADSAAGQDAQAAALSGTGGSARALTGEGSKVTPELVAAISAAIAEEAGTGVEAIRILSIRRA